MTAYNNAVGDGRQLIWGVDNFSGTTIGAGRSASFDTNDILTGQAAGRLTILGLDARANSPLQSLTYRFANQGGVTRLIGNASGVAIYAGGNQTFADLGVGMNYTPLRASSGNAVASGGSGAPIIVNESAIFRAEYQRVSAENGALLGRFIGDQIPFVGTGLAINDFRNDPSLMNGAMVGLSILPAAGTLSGLAKTSKTFSIGWDMGLGSISVSSNLKFGTTAFGQEAHELTGALLTSRLEGQGVVGVIDRTARGKRGIDMSVDAVSARQLGFTHIEIKPNTASGLRTFNSQVKKWGYSPADVRAVTYDAQGKLRWGFDY